MNQIKDKNDVIFIWLSSVCFLIAVMIFLGGLTRLTGSGLSITQWTPITGIIPPLSEALWIIEFEKYQSSPEFLKINFGMDISEFKFIYMMEYIHRLVGRITGLVYIVPLLFFFSKGYIKLKEAKIYIIGILLFLSQGVMGWYMVKSGLISNPHVCHFRLAAHLLLAVILYSFIFWQLMKYSGEFILISFKKSLKSIVFWSRAAIILLFIQIIFGAFVAGLKGGLIYNNFPLMGDDFIPQEIIDTEFSSLLSNPASVQFIHRIIAYILAIVICIFCFKGTKLDSIKFTNTLKYIIAALIFQILAGIITLIYRVPLEIALLHQFGAIILLSCLLRSHYLLKIASL